MESFLNFLSTPAVLSIMALIAGSLWSWGKWNEIVEDLKSKNYGKLIEALEIGATRTYQEFVQGLKTASPTGKLTDDQKREARDSAVAFARQYAKDKGLDLIQEFGESFITSKLEEVVKKLKGKGNGKPNEL